jgi:hypothetical protein
MPHRALFQRFASKPGKTASGMTNEEGGAGLSAWRGVLLMEAQREKLSC